MPQQQPHLKNRLRIIGIHLMYDMSDVNDDGVLDNPGNILYYVPTRTAQKDNYNFSIGVKKEISIGNNSKL